MPELPDVEIFKQYLDATALHQTVQAIDVRSRQVLQEISVQHLQQGLKGRCFETTRRHGKNLFAGLDDGPWLWLHFGMMGDLTYT